MVSTACKKSLVFGTGTFLLIVGAIFGGLWGVIYERMLRMELVLTNSSKSYQMWKDIPIPIYLEFYMFNWTNVAEVEAGKKVKPHFVEMGPYVFREYHHRQNITWNTNGTVTYQQVRSWHFQPDMSNGSLSDKVTNLNMVAATVVYQVRHSGPKLFLVNFLMELLRTKLVVTKTVKELLFDGYDDRLLDIMQKIPNILVPFKRFGYFVERNNSATADGTFSMWTGEDDFLKLGMMDQWNFQRNTGLFQQPCDSVQGSSGDLWPPVTDRSFIHIFASDLCFSLPLSASGDAEAHGLPGKVFVGDRRTLDNGTHFPAAKCQCIGDCQPYGTLNASACRFGSPLFVSFPHFYLADPSYVAPLEGLQPNESLHQFSLTLQPETGMPLHVSARLQLNVLVEPWRFVSIFKHFSQRLYIPTLWFMQRADLTPDLAAQVRTLIAIPDIGRGTLFGIAGIGAFILLVGVCISLRSGWDPEIREITEPLLSSPPITGSYGSVVG